MLERIRNYALYGDTDAESYEAVRGRIEEYNRIMSLVFASVAVILIAAMWVISFSSEGFSSSKPVYFFGVVLSMVQIVTSLLAKRFPVLSYVSVYMAISIFMLYGIAIATLTRPEQQAVTFMVLLIFVPLIFVDRPIRMALVLTVYIFLFIVMAVGTKSGSVLSVDITDAVIFGLLAIVSETVVYRAKLRGYVLEHKLKVLSEKDQLTGINNRNSYELKLPQYASAFRDSIGFIYIDANGLHELNNTYGHKAGDEMLCYLADALSNQFGHKDTYRIGGDEFVAFAPDQPRETIEAKIAKVRDAITEKNYHAAIGYEYRSGQGVAMDELIREAEAKMYQDKTEYYRTHDRRARK